MITTAGEAATIFLIAHFKYLLILLKLDKCFKLLVLWNNGLSSFFFLYEGLIYEWISVSKLAINKDYLSK